MRVAVIGAGIVGITTAWELACDGHDVTVFERRGAAAEETSFANAGVVAPGSVTPWAAPGMPAKVLRYLLSRHAPVKLGLPLSAAELGWMWKWWRACKLDTYLANRARLQRLAFFSRERLHAITAHLALEYDRSDGYMVLLRSERDSKLVQPGLQVLRDAGVAFRQIDAAEARTIEPALNPDTTFAGAIHLPGDEVGNCRQFALLESLEGKKGQPRFKPPFPASYGLYGKPTTINNTETFAAVPWIIRNGGQAYLDVGKPNNGGTKIFSVVGDVERPEQLRGADGHAVLEAARTRRWRARRPGAEGGDPRRLVRPGAARVDHDEHHDGLRRHRQGRLDARLRRRHRDGRDPLHGQEPAAPELLLPARELRPVHAVPRGHRLAVAHGRPHRARQGPHGGHRPAELGGRQHPGPHHLRARRRRRDAGAGDDQALPRRVRSTTSSTRPASFRPTPDRIAPTP